MCSKRTSEFVPPWRWGIFFRGPCTSLTLDQTSPDFEPMNSIYQALKEMGFKETYWQFVYPGQIGGLVKSPRSNLLELHVRFFQEGMMYAEIEMGRSALLHFLNRRLYLNHYIFAKIQTKVSSKHRDYFLEATERYKSNHDRSWTEWGLRNKFMTPGIKRQIRFLTLLSDWRTLAIVMMASVAISFVNGPALFPVLTACMIFIYLLAPKRS